jgi:hypothetical protein
MLLLGELDGDSYSVAHTTNQSRPERWSYARLKQAQSEQWACALLEASTIDEMTRVTPGFEDPINGVAR